MVRHFGVFKFKEGIDDAEVEKCFRTMKEMVGKIPGLIDMEHGAYDSPEGLNDDFTHGFMMTFESAELRDAYLPNPIHEIVKDYVVPKLQRVIVFDFVVS